MKILAIDPGYERLGLAVLSKEPTSKEHLIYSECFRTSSKEDFNERLLQVGNRVSELIQEHQPKTVVLEELYFSTNRKTAMRVAEARGALILATKQHQVPLVEFNPGQIKLAITGNGRATKADIQRMIPYLIKVSDVNKKIDDEIDAIAVGLTFFALEKHLSTQTR